MAVGYSVSEICAVSLNPGRGEIGDFLFWCCSANNWNFESEEQSKAKEYTEALRLYGEAIAIAEVCRALVTLAFCNMSLVTVVVLK